VLDDILHCSVWHLVFRRHQLGWPDGADDVADVAAPVYRSATAGGAVMEAPEAGVNGRLDTGYIAAVLKTLLSQAGVPVILEDKAGGQRVTVPLDSAVAVDGLLPIFLSAGAALWCDATGEAFGLKMEKDIGAYFNWRVKEIGPAKFSALMLAVMEAISHAATPAGIMVTELGRVFDDALARIKDREAGSR